MSTQKGGNRGLKPLGLKGSTIKPGSTTNKPTGSSDTGKKRPDSITGESRDTKRVDNKNSTGDSTQSVSETLHDANGVLYGDAKIDDSSVFDGADDTGNDSNSVTNTESGDEKEPTNAEIMKYLQTMNLEINGRLGKLEQLDERVTGCEKEIQNIWIATHEHDKKYENKTNEVNDRVDRLQFELGQAKSLIDEMQLKNDKLSDSLNYVTSQSMRNNLVFSNIYEKPQEKPMQTEMLLRGFVETEMKISKSIVSAMKFERVHRTGEPNKNGKRNIVAKFTYFKDREMVRRSSSELANTPFFVNEQFPKEVADKRKMLVPKMKLAIEKGSKAWISYDTLYVDGKQAGPDHWVYKENKEPMKAAESGSGDVGLGGGATGGATGGEGK